MSDGNRKSKRITVYLIDDQTMIRAAFRALIQQIPRFEVLGDSGDPREGIKEVKRLKPDVVVLDITMPGLSGLDAIRPLRRASPRTKVLIASQHEGHSFVHRALIAGAEGYISKDSSPEEMRLGIESICRGETFLSPRVAGAIVQNVLNGPLEEGSSPIDALTPREREVFQLIAIGKANKEIAAMLHLSVGTVKKHRENLQRKLSCNSAAEIARLAIREGLLSV